MNTDKESLADLPSGEMIVWSKYFNQLFPTPVKNFTSYFAPINEKYPVGEERDAHYIARMKQLMQEHPDFESVKPKIEEGLMVHGKLVKKYKAAMEVAMWAMEEIVEFTEAHR